MNCTSVTFFKIPIHVADSSDMLYHLFDVLLPSACNEHTNLMILSILNKLRATLHQQKNIDSVLSDFLDAQPYITFNHIYMPDVNEKPRVSVDTLKYILFGEKKFSLNSQENSDFYFTSMICMTMMNKYS